MSNFDCAGMLNCSPGVLVSQVSLPSSRYSQLPPVHSMVSAAPVLNVEQALAHPHTLHREMVVNMDGYQGLGAPVKLGRTPATYRFAPLSEGQDFLLPPQDVRPR